jgi:type II secretory pathway pseudopilin PulG
MKAGRIMPIASARRGGQGAFTLVEVILAIGIVVSLLIVALLFYRQAADLRNQILAESERCSTIRLLLDRLAADLREAMPNGEPGHDFLGDSSSLSFVRSSLAQPRTGAAGAGSLPGLTRITYAAVLGDEGTNRAVIGFDRTEGPPRRLRPALSLADSTNAYLTRVVVPAALDLAITNAPVEPLTELIHFARFRYWDGVAWVSGWTNAAPPPGVEIVLATDHAAETGLGALESDIEVANSDEYPLGAFRRVVVLPAGQPVRKPEDVADEFLSPP